MDTGSKITISAASKAEGTSKKQNDLFLIINSNWPQFKANIWTNSLFAGIQLKGVYNMHCIFTSLMNTFGVKNIEKWGEQVTKHRRCEKVPYLSWILSHVVYKF